MMAFMISDIKVDRYIAIYFEVYGEKIDKVRARDELTSLICLLEAVYQHNNKNNK
jgi:hypothetical protein